MSNLIATPEWDNVWGWDTATQLIGGDGTAPLNKQAQALLNRTELLANSRVIDSITALKAMDSTKHARVFVTGYYAAGDGGGGEYWSDTSDTTSPDDGGSVIIGNDGARWKLRKTTVVSVRQFGAKGDAANDDTTAIQAAINYVCVLNSSTWYGGYVVVPAGNYKISSTIKNYTTSPVASCGIRGAGQFATQFLPAGNITALNIAGQRSDSGDFAVVFPTLPAPSINTACVGVEFCTATMQMSNMTVRNITVYYAFNSFVHKNTSQTMFLVTLQSLTSLRAAGWGGYFDSQNGSTTLTLNQFYARCDNSSGGAPYGSGLYVNNFDDIHCNQLAVDLALNTWVQLVNYSQAQLIGAAFESCSITVNGQRAIQFNGTSTQVVGIKLSSINYSTGGGTAKVIGMMTNAQNLAITGVSEVFPNVSSTTVYYVDFNASTSHLTVVDRSVLPSKVLDNGYFANAVYQGVRLTSINSAPNYGSWVQGDTVFNGTAASGRPNGWRRATNGTSNVLGTDWIALPNL